MPCVKENATENQFAFKGIKKMTESILLTSAKNGSSFIFLFAYLLRPFYFTGWKTSDVRYRLQSTVRDDKTEENSKLDIFQEILRGVLGSKLWHRFSLQKVKTREITATGIIAQLQITQEPSFDPYTISLKVYRCFSRIDM